MCRILDLVPTFVCVVYYPKECYMSRPSGFIHPKLHVRYKLWSPEVHTMDIDVRNWVRCSVRCILWCHTRFIYVDLWVCVNISWVWTRPWSHCRGSCADQNARSDVQVPNTGQTRKLFFLSLFFLAYLPSFSLFLPCVLFSFVSLFLPPSLTRFIFNVFFCLVFSFLYFILCIFLSSCFSVPLFLFRFLFI